MKVNELLMNIHNKEFDLARGLQVKKYLPMEVKKTIAQGIIYECTEEVDGVVKVNSVQRYLSYVKYMITMHTNLEYTDGDYDVLCSTEYCETDLMTAIFETFKNDADKCAQILDFMIDDYVQENSLEFIVAKFLNNVSLALSSKLNEINLDTLLPQDFDMEKLMKFLNTYVE